LLRTTNLTRSLAALVAVFLLAAGCSRSDDETDAGDTTTTTAATDEGGGTTLDEGGFGDFAKVCQDGDAKGATATGVTDTEIHVGTLTDKGYDGVPGLTKEMYDAAKAFTSWCNEHGGILGRQLVLDDLDAKLTESEQRITEACTKDFALVGGGAVFDEDPKDIRVGCDLANIAGYVVSARGRVADKQVQPLPNPVYSLPVGGYKRVKDLYPDAVAHYGVMASNIGAVLLVRDQSVEAAEANGYTVVYSREYAPAGETGWQNFVREARDSGVEVLEFVGQPEGLTSMVKAMDTEGWYPKVILEAPNMYDQKFVAEGGAVAGNTLVRSTFYPYELAKDNKATQDYLDLMERYNPGGKVALLGTQATSSFLLFAQAAAACGSDLTRECLLEKASAADGWTGGGLHSPQTPGNAKASECFLLLSVDGEGFHYDKKATDPNKGIYNCDPGNVVELQKDYGVPKPTK
jgi:hypothetical protein